MSIENIIKTQLTFLFTAACISLNAQQFDSLLTKLDAEYPQEKMYCQFDKSFYNPGETIWFKAYVFSGNDISNISKTIYADLLDEKGKLLERQVAPLLESSAAASFKLPEDIATPIVYVKVYTRWMLNFDSAFLFVKAIPVLINKKLLSKKPPLNPKISLQFFPESGELVEGVESRVAFKASDAKGLPSDVSGDVYDSRKNKIISFSSQHDGMGYFRLTPGSEVYTAFWKDARGEKHETILPAAIKTGIVLELINTGDTLKFTIKSSPALPDNYASVNVTGMLQQQLLFTARAKLKPGSNVNGNIPIENVPPGIAQITVFNNNAQPIAERLVFLHQPQSYFITDLNAALKDMGKRKKNVIQIDVPDTIACNLSVAITDADVNPVYPGEGNIFSHLLLTADIKGYVHNAGYYFSSEADSVIADLDLIMMTNGWRRFKWEKIISGSWPAIKYKPENYLSIGGNVFGLSNIQLANKEITGLLELKNGNTQLMNTEVGRDGKFTFPALLFYDTAKLYYQFNADKNRTLTSSASFKIDNNFMPVNQYSSTDSNWLTGIKMPDSVIIKKNLQASAAYLSELDKLKNVKVLSSVVIKAKQRSKADSMDATYTSGLFKGGDGNTFILEGDPFANAGGTILTYLQGKVAGLNITGSGSQISLSWRGSTPTIYLNEMQQQVDAVQSIPLSDVAMIKVFRPPFFGGFGGGSGGAIAVYLKKGGAINSNAKGLDFANIPGYSPVREFYSPDYSQADISDETGDYRTTLYWNPFVITDKTHRRILLPFYNNDLTRKMKIIIEGCNAEGKLTRVEKVFK